MSTSFESFRAFCDLKDDEASREPNYYPFDIEIDDTLRIDIDKLEIEKYPSFSGGFSLVYEGRYNDEDDVVIKWIENDDPSKRETREQDIQREIKIISQMNHENVVQFIGALVRPGGCAIIMEFAGRETLEQLNSKDMMQSVNFALDVVKALDYIHGQSVIHGDLKAENLVISHDRTKLKLIDFGNAEQTYESFHMIAFRNGTFRIMAPELFNKDENRSYDEKIDVYSFSIVLWELLTCQVAFEDTGAIDIIKAVREGKRPSVSNIPDGIISLLNDCWADDPSTRPDFAEIKERLLTFRERISK